MFAAVIGAYAGKFMALAVNYLPQILLEGCDKGRIPRDIIKYFFQSPRCLNCQQSITWMENVPIVGYRLMQGKCPHCHYPIGLQTFALELGTALLFGFTVLLFGVNPPVIFVLIVSCLLICCFLTDFEQGILPDQFTLSLIWVGLIASLIPIFVTPQEAIVGAVIGYGLFWAINVFYRSLRHFDGMFPGDFKLNAGIGACLGIKLLMTVLLLSFFLLIAVAVFRFLWSKTIPNASDLHKEVAYACYVTIVAFVAIYFKLAGFLPN
jgi:leader peptidase (prepilin peptidase)/N-methyltransferase